MRDILGRVAIQTMTLGAGAVLIVAVAEALNYWLFLRQDKHG